MTIVRATALQSSDEFCGNLRDLASLLVSGDDLENHTWFYNIESINPDGGTKSNSRNLIVFGLNSWERDEEKFRSRYGSSAIYKWGFESTIKYLFQQAENSSIYLKANGIDKGTALVDGIDSVRLIAIEGDYFDSLDEQIPFILQICKKYNIPEPTYYYISGGGSIHFVWVLSSPVAAEKAWLIRMMLLRFTGLDGADGDYASGNSNLSSLLTQRYRVGGHKIKHNKLSGFYGSFKCFSLDNVYSPNDFNSLFENPLGKWNIDFSKDALDVDGFPILNGSSPIKLSPEESYSPEERLSSEWRDKFQPYDQNEIAEAKKLLDSFSAEKVQVKKSEVKKSETGITVDNRNVDLSVIASDKLSIASLLMPKNRQKLSGIDKSGRYSNLYGLACDLIITEKALEELNLPANPSAFDLFNLALNNIYGANPSKHKEEIKLRWQPAFKAATPIQIQKKVGFILKGLGFKADLDPKLESVSKPESDVNNSSVVNNNLLAKATTDYSTFSYVDGGWKRVAQYGDYDLHIVFDKDLLKDAIEPTIALPDKKQKDADWLDPENQKILEPYVGQKRKVVIKGATSKNWTRANLKALGGFCCAKGAGRVFVDDQPFEYFQVADELTLSGDDVILLHKPFLDDVQEIIDIIDREKARAALLESTVGSNKTGIALAVAFHYGIMLNVPVFVSAATRTLCKGIAARCKDLGFIIPVVDDDWLKNRPRTKEQVHGCIFCPDSEKSPNSLIEEFGIKKWIYVKDESSATIYHAHFAPTAISSGRGKHLKGIERLMSGAALGLYLEANITKPCQNWVESKVKGNIVRIKNTYQVPRKFIAWRDNSPHLMLNFAIETKKKFPDATILNAAQAKERDSSCSPHNLKKFWISRGFDESDIICLDDFSDPSHPAYGIMTSEDKFDKFFSEDIKGKIVLGNPKLFTTGTNIKKHCFDFVFDILSGKGSPMSAVQQPMRVRDREGLERHIFINNCGLDHPDFKGYSIKKVAEAIEGFGDRSDKEYQKLGGRVDWGNIESDFHSARYVEECQFLATLFAKNWGKIAYGLMQFQQGWELVDSSEWIKRQGYSHIDVEGGRIAVKEAIREIKLEGECEILSVIASCDLISSDDAKALRRSRTDLSEAEKIKLARYDFHRASLGIVDCDVKNISRWRDGYFRQLRFQFYFLKDAQQYLRLKESKNIEFSHYAGHTFDFDRLTKSLLAGYDFLRELSFDKIINEIRRIAKGGSTEDHIYLRSAPVKVVVSAKKCEKLQLDPNAEHYGIPLNFGEGSPFELIYHRLMSDKMKCYNLLGFSPSGKTWNVLEKLFEKFGYARISNNKKGKALKHYLILFDDNREEFFSHLLHHHQSSVYSEHNPDRDFIWDLASEGCATDPITQDYKLVRNGLKNLKEGKPTILDLIDVGSAEPLEDVPPLWATVPSRQLNLI